jgi:hypothetical protein
MKKKKTHSLFKILCPYVKILLFPVLLEICCLDARIEYHTNKVHVCVVESLVTLA